MIVMLLTEHYLDFLSLKGGCRCSSESIHVKIPYCLKSHDAAYISLLCIVLYIVCLTRNWEVYVIKTCLNFSRHIFGR